MERWSDRLVRVRYRQRPPTTSRSRGLYVSGPGGNSSTSTVPVPVPSVLHSSAHPIGSPRRRRRRNGPRRADRTDSSCRGPGCRSLTSTVPASVPSVFHSSVPCAGSVKTKKSVPPTTTCEKRQRRLGPQVLHPHRAGLGAIAPPQLGAPGRGQRPGNVAEEEQRPAHGREVVGARVTPAPGVSPSRAVCRRVVPSLTHSSPPWASSPATKKSRVSTGVSSAIRRSKGGARERGELLHRRGARGAPIALPQAPGGRPRSWRRSRASRGTPPGSTGLGANHGGSPSDGGKMSLTRLAVPSSGRPHCASGAVSPSSPGERACGCSSS